MGLDANSLPSKTSQFISSRGKAREFFLVANSRSQSKINPSDSPERFRMRVSIIQGRDGLTPESSDWGDFERAIRAAEPDLLLMNEMPFGHWLAQDDKYDPLLANASLAVHRHGLSALRRLGVRMVLSSQPVETKNCLANEAFALVNGVYLFGHQKHYFPNEDGYYEKTWFQTEITGFDVIDIANIRCGFLICTELFFNEWARHYRRLGASLIAVPRASGMSYERWRIAATMAALVSGCYVVTSNRAGKSLNGQQFGGRGFAVAPDGTLIAETSEDTPISTFELDEEWSARQRTMYPCYVDEAPIRE
jgi:predicted amidohydrolase